MKNQNNIRFILTQVQSLAISVDDAMKLLEELMDTNVVIQKTIIPSNIPIKEPVPDPFKPHINPIIC